jgi:hypothetical protein
MKRADLKAGEAYYYDRQRDWETAKYGDGERVVLVDLGPYTVTESGRLSSRNTERYTKTAKGNAVLVEITEYPGTKMARTVSDAVLITHLRGPWESTNAEVQQRIADRRARTAQQDRERADANAAAASVTARAKTLGLRLGNRPRYGDGKTEIVMTAEVAAKLLDAMNLARWLVSMDDTDDPAGMAERRSVTLTSIINRARGVLGEQEG